VKDTVVSLSLVPPWQKEKVLLVRAADALRLCHGGGFAEVPYPHAQAYLGALHRREMGKVRDFVLRARIPAPPLAGLDDDALWALLVAWVGNRELRVLVGAETAVSETDKALAERRRLVREIEQQTRGRLAHGGRSYRLVAGEDLGRLPDRDRYEVAGQGEAARVLDAVAREHGGGTVGLPGLLAQARAKLARDWRPPFEPDGLVLLRRVPVLTAQKQEAPAITPSALRKLRDEGWIEIVFVDAGMEPVADVDFDLKLADGGAKSGKTNAKGLARCEGITPGECKVRFPKAKGPVVLV
jgi:hypothetical protein